MEVYAHRVVGAHLLEDRVKLFAQRRPASCHHLRHQQAGEDAVLFGHVPVDAETSAFFASDGDLVRLDKLADILEAHRGLVDLYAVVAGYGVNKVGGGNAAGDATGPVGPGLDQVIEQQGDDVVG